MSFFIVFKEFDEEECCNVEIKQEVVDDPLDVTKEKKYPSFNERNHDNALNTPEELSIKTKQEINKDVIKEEICVNFSNNNRENQLKTFEFKDDLKFEIEGAEKTMDVIQDYVINSGNYILEINSNRMSTRCNCS